uniref:Uncharacterized protein n=1 Tax=Arundo donax TaxID=35708 RepID=A0A0A8YRR0_ARUDO
MITASIKKKLQHAIMSEVTTNVLI